MSRPVPGTIAHVETRLAEGHHVDPRIVARAISDYEGVVPPLTRDFICRHLEGEYRKPRRARRDSPIEILRVQAATSQYERLQQWLRQRNKRCGLVGWPALHEADWWQGPPAERAARMIAKRWFGGHITWRQVQNIVSSVRRRGPFY